MTLDEYEQTGKALYGAFAEVVASILAAALQANGSVRVQVIQKRAKASAEVRKKLDGAVNDIETKVKDLAGARVVVYSNSDIAHLGQSGILPDNFEIVWERTRFHYPRAAEPDQSQFIGRNYVVRLKDSRAALPEYKRFAGLQCEVQVQTILDHAWSETAHDTIYKSPKLAGVGTSQMAKIRERMQDIQQKYLLPAGHEFQQVLNDFEHIVSGQHLVDSDILVAIRDATDNNLRVELLEKFATVVLPIIDDKVAAAPEIRSSLVAAARAAQAIAVTPMETPLGSMSGRTHEDVLEKILSILSDVRYLEPADTYATYVELSSIFTEPQLRQKIIAAVGDLAQHTLRVWREYGPTVQETLLDYITATPNLLIASARALVIEVARKCLEPDVTGTSSTSTTFILETGSVPMTDRVQGVRNRAMDLLKDLFKSSQTEEERWAIYQALQEATRLPSQGNYGNPLLERALSDTTSVVLFFTDRADDVTGLLKAKAEHDALFHYRRAREMPADTLQTEGMRGARDAVVSAATALRDRYNADAEFVTFKTLVGFESVFEYEWDEDDSWLNFETKSAYRKARAAEYLIQVTNATADRWFDRLDGYASIRSGDLAMFPVLGNFIAEIAESSPAIAASWLDRSRGKPLALFTPGMLRGLYASDRDEALKWISAAIDRRDDLSGIAHFIRFAEPATPSLLDKVAEVSIAADDTLAVHKVLEACAARPADFGTPLASRLAVETVEFLSERSHYRWTEPMCGWGKRSGLLSQLSEAERSRLFAAIRDLPKIDFRAEEILAAYAEEHAAEIIELFGARLAYERTMNAHAFPGKVYEAIPSGFSRLHMAMQHTGPLLLPKALEWHRVDPVLGRFKSAAFVANVFPELPANVVWQLIEYAKSGDSSSQNFVIDVMANYDGAPVAFSVMKELVAVLGPESKLLGGVRSALGETGVMHGEFGHRDAIATERERLATWRTDEREAVRHFADAQIRWLDNAIAAAQQEAEAEIAMRKLKYGEDLTDNSPERIGRKG